MQNYQIRFTDDPIEIVWILAQLAERLPQLQGNEDYARSVPHYISSGAYKFITYGPSAAAGDLSAQTAFGFVSFFRLPMAERKVLSVEAFWFADNRAAGQLPVWSFIADLAQRMEFHGVFVTEVSVNTPFALRELVQFGAVGQCPVASVSDWIQADVPGIYSPLSGGPLPGSVFNARGVRIFTLLLPVDFSGATNLEQNDLFRGEGRLENAEPHKSFSGLKELAEFHLASGFEPPPDSSGPFRGTVPEQILHQGYVPQHTVSMTSSFEMAALYATKWRRREGVVFQIDANRLRGRAAVFDSAATLAKHCDWMFQSEFETIQMLVMEAKLGLKATGRFLEHCNSEARDFVANGYGGVRSLVGPVDWSTYFETAEDLERAEAIVGTRALDSLHNAFEHYWMFALGQIGSEDRIQSDGHGNTSVETKPTGHFGYQIAFSLVEEKLKNAPKGRKPGWDLTPLGYIAKTCVDQEFFSNGPISGDCVISATFVDKVGTPVGSQIRH